MRRFLLIVPALLATVAAGATVAQAQPGSENRCGWYANPTPGNHWITDRDREWLIGAQGGYQSRGINNMPDLTTNGWVTTNGNYGYGCACMRVRTDRRNSRITQIYSARAVPLAQCRRDRNLSRPD